MNPTENALTNMKLDGIIKETHKLPIKNVSMNRSNGVENLMLTSAAFEVSIYDNNHCNGHLDLMSHFLNKKKGEKEPKDAVTSSCWIRDGKHVAAGDSAGLIHVISITNSRVMATYDGHSGCKINHLCNLLDSDYFSSTSDDSKKAGSSVIRIWNSKTHSSLATIHVGAKVTCSLYDHNQKVLYCGDSSGHVMTISVNQDDPSTEATVIYKFSQSVSSIQNISKNKFLIHCKHKLHLCQVDNNMLEVKSTLSFGQRSVGCNYDYHMMDGELAPTFYVAVGTRDAEVLIYRWTAEENKVIKKLLPPTNKKQGAAAVVKGVALSHDCKSLMAVSDDGVIWRFVGQEEAGEEQA
ncbi:hypothetical protein AKO1_014750 [Acrasis kona]|uniref:Uncharacterized protein n=1 Tax=Acrasis kona TaxID=1008807 RepID=A0AAW2Z117_9EUKA